VYFIQDTWYQQGYVSRYPKMHHHDRGHHEGWDKHDRDRGEGEGRGTGHRGDGWNN